MCQEKLNKTEIISWLSEPIGDQSTNSSSTTKNIPSTSLFQFKTPTAIRSMPKNHFQPDTLQAVKQTASESTTNHLEGVDMEAMFDDF